MVESARWQPSGDDYSEFRRVWKVMAHHGQCDAFGGMECRRVLEEWVLQRGPRPIDRFIRERANVSPAIAARPPAFQITGRGWHQVIASTTATTEGVVLRLDDEQNPELWMEVRIAGWFLIDCLRQISQARKGEVSPEDLPPL